MDEKTRAERVWLLKNYMERIRDPHSACPPLIDLYIAFFAAYLHDNIPDVGWDIIKQVDSHNSDAGTDFSMSISVGRGPLGWIDLNTESAPEMFKPERPHADWRAGIGESGYVTLHAVIKMLDHYANTGQIHWESPTSDPNALQELCESHGIVWFAWQAAPPRGWIPPGAERTAIVRFNPDITPNTEMHLLEHLVSDIAGYNVSLITPEQIWEERRQAELERAELVYDQAD